MDHCIGYKWHSLLNSSSFIPFKRCKSRERDRLRSAMKHLYKFNSISSASDLEQFMHGIYVSSEVTETNVGDVVIMQIRQ